MARTDTNRRSRTFFGPTRYMRYLVLGFFLSLITASRSYAHDFWIEPSSFRPLVGQTITLRLRVGEHFLGDPVARDPQAIVNFFATDEREVRAVQGVEGSNPAGMLLLRRPGTLMIGYRTRPRPVQLEAEKFEKYLRDEGLERIIAIRASRGEQKKPGSEIFSRSVKALLIVEGKQSTSAFAGKPLGLTLELISETDLSHLPLKSPSRFRLLFNQKPLGGALVKAINRQNPSRTISSRSDAKGRVLLALDSPGEWLVKAVHMIPAATGSGAEWESIWTSLTFQADPLSK